MPVVFALFPGELGHILENTKLFSFTGIVIIVGLYWLGHHLYEEKKAEDVRKANAAYELRKLQEAQKKSSV